ncbi:outer membrane beta-barrel domain-containing protein [bacterium]|nr:outer membrane beta-barrel domain-containing protein [bacterium]
MIKFYLCVLILLCCSSYKALADDVDSIETLFTEDGNKDEKKSEDEAKAAEFKVEKAEQINVTKLENLNQLKPFEDIAVIQKRYLPKTERFEANINASTNINDAYFSAYGIGGGLTYNFNEKFAVEGIVKWFSASNSSNSKNLLDRGVVVNGMVVTEVFYGADFRWTPIYGKFSYFDKKIIPFDHYFSIGLGQTQLATGSSASGSSTNVRVEALNDPITLRISTGEVFALTKWMVFRWDVSWHFMQPEVRTTRTSPTTTSVVTDDIQNNLFINFGLSFYFPEAKYR